MCPGHLCIVSDFLAEFGPSHGIEREFGIVCPLALPPSFAPRMTLRRAEKCCALFMQVVFAD